MKRILKYIIGTIMMVIILPLIIYIIFFVDAVTIYAQTVAPTYPPAAIGVVWPDGTIVLVCVPKGDGTYTANLVPNQTGSSGYVGLSTQPGAIVYTQPGSVCPSPTSNPTPTNAPAPTIVTPSPIPVTGTPLITQTPNNIQQTGVSSVGPTSLPVATPTPVILTPTPTIKPIVPKLTKVTNLLFINMILAELKNLLKGGIYG